MCRLPLRVRVGPWRVALLALSPARDVLQHCLELVLSPGRFTMKQVLDTYWEHASAAESVDQSMRARPGVNIRERSRIQRHFGREVRTTYSAKSTVVDGIKLKLAMSVLECSECSEEQAVDAIPQQV